MRDAHGVISPVDAAIAALKKRPDCPPDQRYLIGVSGGRDSVALLHALVRGGYKRLLVCHLDHGIRGNAARADAQFVEKCSCSLGLASEVRRADVRAIAIDRKISLETAAREARKEFFFEVARSRRCRNVLLAHQADDQVETVLFNLCRGTGSLGLAGMRIAGEWKFSGTGRRRAMALNVIRPLLGVWRREIDAYIEEHHFAYREDETNADPVHTRNRVRHEIVPLLDEVIGRDTSRNIWRTAEIIGGEESFLREHFAAREAFAAQTIELKYKDLSKASVAEQRRILRTWLRGRGCAGIGFEEVERTRCLLDPGSGPAKINLPGGLCARRRAGMLFIEAANQTTAKTGVPKD